MYQIDNFLNDLLFVLEHIHVSPETAARKWSIASCADYQLPLVRLTSYLNSFNQEGTLSVNNTPEHRVLVEIVTKSRLNDLLEYREVDRYIKYRDTVPLALREQVRIFIMENTGAIGRTD